MWASTITWNHWATPNSHYSYILLQFNRPIDSLLNSIPFWCKKTSIPWNTDFQMLSYLQCNHSPCATLLSVICVSYMWISLKSGSLWPKTLPGVTPLQWPNWGNSIAWGGIGDYLADDGLHTPVAHVLPSIECNDALGIICFSFMYSKLVLCTAGLFVYCDI